MLFVYALLSTDLVNKLISISISIRKNCIRMVFCLFCKKNFYPTLFTLLYFIILVVATSLWWGTKNQDKNEQFNIAYDHRYLWTGLYVAPFIYFFFFLRWPEPWIEILKPAISGFYIRFHPVYDAILLTTKVAR